MCPPKKGQGQEGVSYVCIAWLVCVIAAIPIVFAQFRISLASGYLTNLTRVTMPAGASGYH